MMHKPSKMHTILNFCQKMLLYWRPLYFSHSPPVPLLLTVGLFSEWMFCICQCASGQLMVDCTTIILLAIEPHQESNWAIKCCVLKHLLREVMINIFSICLFTCGFDL